MLSYVGAGTWSKGVRGVAKSSTPDGERRAAGEPAQTTGTGRHQKLGSESESVVVATFPNRHAAEHMVASLGRGFRRKARKGEVAAFLVTGNRDGSFSLVQSRVLTASGVVAAGIGVTVATVAGLLGIVSALRGGRTVVHAARHRQAHVGADEEQLRHILARLGADACATVIRCAGPQGEGAVATLAAARASDSWHGSRAEFLAALDQAVGSHDWLRAAFDEPPKASG